MKQITIILLAFLPLFTLAQKKNPVRPALSTDTTLKNVIWSINAIKSKPGEYLLHFQAKIDNGYHINSSKEPVGFRGNPTRISFDKNPKVILSQIQEYGSKINKKSIHGKGAVYYEQYVDFVIKATIPDKSLQALKGTLIYQVSPLDELYPAKTKSFILVLDDVKPSVN